jgi:hypothetical protein
MNFDDSYLEAAHEHRFSNEAEVCSCEAACCIACARSFPANLVTQATGQAGDGDRTMYCPVCTFDTVIGDQSGLPVNDHAFIAAMKQRYQNEPLPSEEEWKEMLNAPNH